MWLQRKSSKNSNVANVSIVATGLHRIYMEKP